MQLANPARFGALKATGLLDRGSEESLDRLTRLAQRIFAAKIALILLMDGDRLFVKSAQGLPEPWARERQIPLGRAFCRHVLASGAPLRVCDAGNDPSMRDDPAVRELDAVAYMGAPLRTPDAQIVGTMCVIDRLARQWTESDLASLADLSHAVMAEIAARFYRLKVEGAEGALRARESRIVEILESIDEGYYELDRDFRFVYVNSTAERLWKRRRDELLGQGALAVFPGWADSDTYRAHRQTMADGQPRRIETVSALLGVPVEINLRPAPSGLSVFFRDVSHRRRMEEELRERSEALALAEDSAGIGVWDVDLLTGLARGTPQFFRLLGLDPTSDPVPFEVFRSLRYPEDRQRVVEGFRQAIASGQDFYEMEYRILRADGKTRWIFGRGRVVRDVKGTPVRYSGVDIDVTGRKTAEAALAESEERYRALVENANDLVAALDLDMRFTSVNTAVERLFGYSAEDLVGQPLRRYLPEGFEFDESDLRRKLANGGPVIFELEVVGATGSGSTLEVNSRFALDSAGKPVGVHAIARDITERKHAEARQLLLIRELQHRTKNMLAVVQAIVTNTLARAGGIETAREAVIGRLHALARAQDFVASGAAGGAPLRELVESEVSSFGERAAIKGPAIYADIGFAQMFALVVHELATNAVKHGSLSTSEGRVRVRWKIDGSGPEAKFRFSWVERDGPPVEAPSHSGFGSRLIANALAAKPRIAFTPRGFEYRIRVPLSAVTKPGDAQARPSRAGGAIPTTD